MAEEQVQETAQDGGEQTEQQSEPQAIPYERFQEVVNKRRTAETEAKKLRQKLEQLGDIDPDEYRTLKEQRQEAEAAKLKKEGDFEALKDQLKSKYQKELEARDSDLGRTRSALQKHLIEGTAIAAIAKEKGSAKLLLPHVVSRARMVEEDGEYRVEVLGANGEPMFNAEGERASIEDVVRELKASEDFLGAFEATGRAGSGAQGSQRYSGGSLTLEKFDAMPTEEQASLYHENPELYRNMMRQKRSASERTLLGR